MRVKAPQSVNGKICGVFSSSTVNYRTLHKGIWRTARLALLGETRVLSVDSALRLKYHPYPSRVRSPGGNRALAAGSAEKGGALST